MLVTTVQIGLVPFLNPLLKNFMPSSPWLVDEVDVHMNAEDQGLTEDFKIFCPLPIKITMKCLM